MTNRPIVAMMYDFDRTLCTKDMQEYGFIPAIKMTAQEFWNEVNEMTDREKMDNILAYMFKMVEKGRERQVPIWKPFISWANRWSILKEWKVGLIESTAMERRLVCG